MIVEKVGDQNEKRLMKIVNLRSPEITTLTTIHDKYLVCGFKNGHIKFYDFDFKIVSWFDDLGFSEVKSISFSKKKPTAAATGNKMRNMLEAANTDNKHKKGDEDDEKDKYEEFACSDFLVADSSALICSLKAELFETIKGSQENQGYTIMCGTNSAICGVAVHPTEPMLVVACNDGTVFLWNYEKQSDPQRNFVKQNKEEKKLQIFHSVEFVPDGSEILFGRYDCKIDVMDAATGQYKLYNNPPATSVEADRYDAVKQIVVNDKSTMFATWDSSR